MLRKIIAALLEFSAHIAELSTTYPIVVGGIGVWTLGVLTYGIKYIPAQIYSILRKQATTRLTLMSSHNSYHDFIRWYEKNGYSKKSRSIKVSNGRYGYSDAIKGVGYGTHYFWLGWKPVKLTLSRLDTKSDRELDEITLVTFGRDHTPFDKIFSEIASEMENRDKVAVLKYKDAWNHSTYQRKRSINTIHLNKGVKETILDYIDNFKNKETYHIEHGLNHQTALMLYGPPGTGKTSIIKAIASHYDMDIYSLSVTQMGKIESAFSSLPENALVVIEDIDSDYALFSREDDEGKILPRPFGFGLSEVLNSIDGLITSHGRILIATTNYIEKLDAALLRSGRFDLKIKIDYADIESLKSFASTYFPGEIFPDNLRARKNIAPSDVQNYILSQSSTMKEFLSKFTEQISPP